MILKGIDGTQIDGSCRRISAHVIEITSGSVLDELGVTMYRNDGSLLFDGSAYTTLYRTVDGGYQLSDDGSVYTEPEATELDDTTGTEVDTGPTPLERLAAAETALEEQNLLIQYLAAMNDIYIPEGDEIDVQSTAEDEGTV